MYLGDCAALSFLQNIQELIEGEGELTTIAQDVGGFPVYEEVPPVVRDGNILAYNTMDMQDIKELINVFFASVRYLSLGVFQSKGIVTLILVIDLRHSGHLRKGIPGGPAKSLGRWFARNK